MLALIDESRMTWTHVVDLAVGCVDAWLRALQPASEKTRARLAMVLCDFGWPFLGAVLVRFTSDTAISFGFTPSEAWRYTLAHAFAVFIPVAMLPNLWFSFRDLIRVTSHQAPTNDGLSRPVVWALTAATLILATGNDLTRPDTTLPFPPSTLSLTVLLLLQIQQASAAGRARRRAARPFQGRGIPPRIT
jgi:hypothetical protein